MSYQQNSNWSVKKILILVVILALPGFCYYLLKEKGENSYKPLPKYGEKELSGTYHTRRGEEIPDTVFHTVESFSLLSLREGGRPFVFKQDYGVSVVGFYHLGNRSLADKINAALNKMAVRFAQNEMVRFYSINVDSIRDAPIDMVEYADSYDYKGPNWVWLYGASPERIKSIGQEQFLIDIVPMGDGGFIQSPSLVLVDSHARIRGVYDATLQRDVDKLFDETKLLLTEEIRNISVNKNE